MIYNKLDKVGLADKRFSTDRFIILLKLLIRKNMENMFLTWDMIHLTRDREHMTCDS